MTIGDRIAIGNKIWTVVNMIGSKAMLISEPVKSCVADINQNKYNHGIIGAVCDCLITMPLIQYTVNIFQCSTSSIHGVSLAEYDYASISLTKIIPSNIVFLPGIEDCFENLSFYKHEDFQMYTKGTPTNISHYLVNVDEVVLRDCVHNNDVSEEDRPLLCYANALKTWTKDTQLDLVQFALTNTDWDPKEQIDLYCGMETERWLQLCCWIDINKYESLPTRAQIMGMDL